MDASVDADVVYYFLGHCDLDLVFRIILLGAYLLHYLSYESQIWCLVASLDGSVMY